MVNNIALLAALVAYLAGFSSAYVPQSIPKAIPAKRVFDFKQAVAATFTAATIASTALVGPIAEAADFTLPSFGSSTVVAEKVTREGLYRPYEAEIDQVVDDARSTFKEAKETKSKKGKYTALLAVLVVGSFIIPMAQYFWYVKDDDSSDRFFAADQTPDPEPPKKRGRFGKK